MATYIEGRECRICGALIGDDNPDGIGGTCREVWEKSMWTTFYHFKGLDVWQAKVNYWLTLFLKTFEKTKFRSQFKKDFYLSSKERYETGGRFSKKQLTIIQEMLVDGTWPKISDKDENKKVRDDAKSIVLTMFDRFKALSETDPEVSSYRLNCAKKYYGEASHARSQKD